MAVINLLPGTAQILDQNGRPIAGAQIFAYQANTLTPLPTFNDSILSSQQAHPHVLDGEGRGEMWVASNVDILVKRPDGTQVLQRNGLNPDQSTAQLSLNLIANNSFEINTSGDGKSPDSWTLTEETGGVASLDADSFLGAKAMKFVSTGGGGGNVITSDFFEVAPSEPLDVRFAVKASVVDIRILVQVHLYDVNKALITSPAVYDEAAANPTVYTVQQAKVTPPVNARFGKIQLYGAHPSDATPGTAFFDDVRVTRDLGLGGIAGLDLADVVPPGVQWSFAGSILPTGFLWCDGAAVSRSSFAALFAAIGTTYGAGNGSTTFNVPDLRGRVPFGKDDMGGTAADRLQSVAAHGVDGVQLGASGGVQEHALSIAELAAHDHEIVKDALAGLSASAGAGWANPVFGLGSNSNTQLRGDGAAHTNLPPALVCNWIIKT